MAATRAPVKRWGFPLPVLRNLFLPKKSQVSQSPRANIVLLRRAFSNEATFAGSSTALVKSIVVPIPRICDMGPDSFLACCVKLAQRQRNVAVFEKTIVAVLLDYKFRAYGQSACLLFGALSFLLALSFSISTYLWVHLPKVAGLVWTCIMVTIALPLCFIKLLQIALSGTKFRVYDLSGWDVVDILTFCSLAAVMALRMSGTRGRPTFVLAASVSLLLWLRLLYYFRGYKRTGILVRTVFQIARDIRLFLLILFLLVLAFGNAFYVLAQYEMQPNLQSSLQKQSVAVEHCNTVVGPNGPFNNCTTTMSTTTHYHNGSSLPTTAAFGTFAAVLLSLFNAMTGQYNFSVFVGSSFLHLEILLYLVYVVLQYIIMLNMLIAM